MNFPIAVLDKQEYDEKLFELLNDDETVIFIDTNMFALFYKLHEMARNEFFDWFKPLIEKGRIRVPAWSMHEYTNRFIRNKAHDYLSQGRKLSTVHKEYKDIMNFLKMNVDENRLTGSHYSDIQEYHDDIGRIDELLDKIYKVSKGTKDDYIVNVHESISEVFKDSILESDISAILQEINDIGEARFQQRIPPGFEDDSKGDNKYGDLIIWFEMLEFVSNNQKFSKAIFLSNDQKKDWVYAPQKIFNGTRNVANSNFKIADSRLVSEFSIKTGGNDFYIIETGQLLQLLIQNKTQFEHLPKAFQLSQKTDEDETTHLGFKTVNLAEIMAQPTMPVPEPDGNYTLYALADGLYDTEINTVFQKEINMLISHNWYEQNIVASRIELILLTQFGGSEQSLVSERDALFVLGRNLYQSACGDAFDIINLISNLNNIFTSSLKFNRSHVVAGMIYEIYFNSKNKFRIHGLKGRFFQLLVSQILENREFYSEAIKTIQTALYPFKDILISNPFEDEESVTIEVELSDPFDWFEDSMSQTVKKITHGDRKLTYISEHGFQTGASIDELESKLKEKFGLLDHLTQFKYNNHKEDVTYFVIEPNLEFTFDYTITE